MKRPDFHHLFNTKKLEELFPHDRADMFFEAMYGDASEGAYDIYLTFKDYSPKELVFEFHLNQRSGKCLACNLTYGLPTVFARHPVINIKKLVENISQALPDDLTCTHWEMGNTAEKSSGLHIIPLKVAIGK